MILIADSGSTKTDWCLTASETVPSPLKDRIVSHEQYMSQEMGRATTASFPLAAWEEMKASTYLFARKFTR